MRGGVLSALSTSAIWNAAREAQQEHPPIRPNTRGLRTAQYTRTKPPFQERLCSTVQGLGDSSPLTGCGGLLLLLTESNQVILIGPRGVK
jgi:hypothetical protein